MARRIGVYVTSGVLKNTHRNQIHGRLQIQGWSEPLELTLVGDMIGELFRKKVRFRRAELPDDADAPPLSPLEFEPRQFGPSGEIAFRQVRIPTMPIAEFCRRVELDEMPPTVLMQCLYIEWYGPNGRVVAEIPVCDCHVSDAESPDSADDATSNSGDDAGEPERQELWQRDMSTLLRESMDRAATADAESSNVDEQHDDKQGEDKQGDEASDSPYTVEAMVDDEEDEEGEEEDNDEEFPYDVEIINDGEAPWNEQERNDPYGLFSPELEQHLEAANDFGSFEESTGVDDFDQRPLTLELDLDDWPFQLRMADNLSEGAVEFEVKMVLSALALYRVAIEICPHTTWRAAYKYLVDTIIPELRDCPELLGRPQLQHYSTAAVCRECARTSPQPPK